MMKRKITRKRGILSSFDLRPTRLARRRARMLGGGDLKRVPDTPDAGHPGDGGDRA